MHQKSPIRSRIHLDRIVENVRAVKARVGVEVWPVVKADAYGLGAQRVAEALRQVADGYCVFALDEAIDIDLHRLTGKPVIALGPGEPVRLSEYLAHHVRPVVCGVEQAKAMRDAQPILNIDTGMQRFACCAEVIGAALEAGAITEAITHATTLAHVETLKRLTGGRSLKLHAAATALLNEPAAWLDAVRPGRAIYDGAVEVSARLVEVRRANGPVGYTGFKCERFGVFLGGYANGLRTGPCSINGRHTEVVEVGMQTSFVRLDFADDVSVNDEVMLLGNEVPLTEVAKAWHCSAQEVLTQLVGRSRREYPEANVQE